MSAKGSKVEEEEDVAKSPVTQKTFTSSTVVSTSTFGSSPMATSTASGEIINEIHESTPVSKHQSACDTTKGVDGPHSTVTQGNEDVNARSAQKTTDIKGHFRAIDTPDMLPWSTRKNLFQNVSPVIKPAVGTSVMGHESHNEGAEKATNNEAEDSEMNEAFTSPSFIQNYSNDVETLGSATSVVAQANVATEPPSPDAAQFEMSIKADFGDDFNICCEHDSPDSAAFAEELGAARDIDSAKKSLAFEILTQEQEVSADHADSLDCCDDDLPPKGQPTMSSSDTFNGREQEEKKEFTPMGSSSSMSPPDKELKNRSKQSAETALISKSARVIAKQCVLENTIAGNAQVSPYVPRATVGEKSPIVPTSTSSPNTISPKTKLKRGTGEGTKSTSPMAVQDQSTLSVEDMTHWIKRVRREIKADDEWRCVMAILRENGITYERGSGLVSYSYTFPNRKSRKNGGVSWIDYVENEEDLKAFACNEMGWGGGYDFAKQRENEAKRALFRGMDSPGSSISSEKNANEVEFKGKQTSFEERPKKRTRHKQNESEVKDRAVLAVTQETLHATLLGCQKALQTSFDVQTLPSASSKFQTHLDAVDSFLSAFVAHDGENYDKISKDCNMLYVCGAPGVGKTTAVTHACRRLCDIHGAVILCHISGSQVKSRTSIMRNLANAMAITVSEHKIQEALCSSRRKSETPKVVMIIDEIDDLLSAARGKGNKKARNESEDTLMMLMDWARKPNFSFALIGISNAVGGESARRIRELGMNGEQVTFSTYCKEDLIRIVVDRVGENVVHDKAIEFAASKVAAGTGDVRLMLELISCAIQKCLEGMSPDQLLSINMDSPLVTIAHMMKAVKAIKSMDNYCDRIEGLPHLTKIVLCVAVTLSQVSPSCASIPAERLHNCTRSVMGQMNPDDEFSLEMFRDSVSSLFDQGLLLSDEGDGFNSVPWTTIYKMPIRLGCQLQDVESALAETLGDNSFYAGVLERARTMK